MAEIGQPVVLDLRHTRRIFPHPMDLAIHALFPRWRAAQTHQAAPLADEGGGIVLHDNHIRRAVPDRQARPRPGMVGSAAHCGSRIGVRPAIAMGHHLKRAADADGGPERQARNHRASREDIRIGRQQGRRHGTARRQAGHEDAARIDAMHMREMRDHGGDRACFPAVARRVALGEPVETMLRIVAARLLGQAQDEAVTRGQTRPAGAEIIVLRRLPAAVQHDDQRRTGRQLLRDMDQHTQLARIGTEIANFNELGRIGLRGLARRGRHFGLAAGQGRKPLLPIAIEVFNGFSNTAHVKRAIRSGKGRVTARDVCCCIAAFPRHHSSFG